jgi:predicted metal-dependent HD superfamily phosphohydrolase
MPQTALKNSFISIINLYSDAGTAASFWRQVEASYTDRKRHYHTMSHLVELHKMLSEVKQQIVAWDAIILAIAWHDVIYNPLRSDNEERSANFSEVWLQKIEAPVSLTQMVCHHIMATQKHVYTENADTNLFIDADIAILGAPESKYADYAAAIRKEYAIYPDMIYKPGRIKVLRQFLELPDIYKTSHFHQRFEAQARKNIEAELVQLGG